MMEVDGGRWWVEEMDRRVRARGSGGGESTVSGGTALRRGGGGGGGSGIVVVVVRVVVVLVVLVKVVLVGNQVLADGVSADVGCWKKVRAVARVLPSADFPTGVTCTHLEIVGSQCDANFDCLKLSSPETTEYT